MDTLGHLFKVTNFGESESIALGAVIEGCPSLLPLKEKDIQFELDKRKPGQALTTQRQEKDTVKIVSGVKDGKTTGSPITMIVYNQTVKKKDNSIFRPSHADFTHFMKYGVIDGRASARTTIGIVAAGAIARKIVDLDIVCYVKSIKDIVSDIDTSRIKQSDVYKSAVRCPGSIEKRMIDAVKKAESSGDSVGGVIECMIRNPPIGLGEPLYDSLDADLAKAMLSINAVKGFEIGAGFAITEKFGSEANDIFHTKGKRIATKTNNSGGIQGGISNGMPIVFRLAFKPTPSIAKEQQSLGVDMKQAKIRSLGTNDPCVCIRAVPVVEAMAYIVMADHYLMNKARRQGVC